VPAAGTRPTFTPRASGGAAVPEAPSQADPARAGVGGRLQRGRRSAGWSSAAAPRPDDRGRALRARAAPGVRAGRGAAPGRAGPPGPSEAADQRPDPGAPTGRGAGATAGPGHRPQAAGRRPARRAVGRPPRRPGLRAARCGQDQPGRRAGPTGRAVRRGHRLDHPAVRSEHLRRRAGPGIALVLRHRGERAVEPLLDQDGPDSTWELDRRLGLLAGVLHRRRLLLLPGQRAPAWPATSWR
jgi:hypothetical protein